ncbi:hypothetical protein GE061_014968, partial [Apolygus lucorum]
TAPEENRRTAKMADLGVTSRRTDGRRESPTEDPGEAVASRKFAELGFSLISRFASRPSFVVRFVPIKSRV